MIASLFTVGTLTFASEIYFDCLPFISVASAEVKMYTGVGEGITSDIESPDMAKLRARANAMKNAQEQAGIYLKHYSRTINANLIDDEISAITNNIVEEIGETQYEIETVRISDEITVIHYRATVKVNIDTEGISNYLKRNSEEKRNIVIQNTELQKSIDENNKEVEDIRQQAIKADTESKKSNVKEKFEKADKDFLYNQKLKESGNLNYQEKYDEAIKLCNEAIEIDPNKENAYLLRGFNYWELEQYDESMANFNKIIEINPNFEMAYMFRGYAQILAIEDYWIANRKNFDDTVKNMLNKAIEDFTKAIQINQVSHNKLKAIFNPDADVTDLLYTSRAFVYNELKKYDEAIEDYNKAIELAPDNAKIYDERGLIYDKLEKYDEAINDFTKAIQIAPNSSKFYRSRGSSYGALGKYDEAIGDFTKAIQLDPNDKESYKRRASVYALLEKYDEALKDYNKAIKIDPNFADAYYYRGLVYDELKKYNKAIKDYNKSIQHNAYEAKYYYRRGMAYKALGDEVKAEADIAKAKELGYEE